MSAGPQPGREAALSLSLPLAGAAAGALTAVAAFAVHPAAVPVLAGLAGLAALSLSRIEVGVAAAFVLLPLGYVADLGPAPWFPGTAWIAVLLAIALVRGRPPSIAAPRLAAAIVLLLAVTVVGAATADELGDALPVVRSLLTGLALAWVIATQVRSLAQVRVVLAGLSAATVVVGGYAAYQYLGPVETTSGFFTQSGVLARRVSAGFAQPNQLGGILVLLVPFAIAGLVLHRRAALLHGAALALGVYGVYVSFSRGALVALAAIPLVFARGRALLVVLPLLAGTIALATPDLVEERFATLTEQGSEIATRLDFWKVAVAVWADAPLLGTGLGGFADAYSAARIPGKEFLPATIFEPPPHAHNLALHTLAEQGVAGLVALLLVLAAAVQRAAVLRRHPARWVRIVAGAVLAAVVALVIHNLVDVTLFDTTAIIFWAVLGLLATGAKGLGTAVDTARSEARED